MSDNYDLWERREAELEARLGRRPKCCECGEAIQEDIMYIVDGECYCLDCLKGAFAVRIKEENL